MVRTTIAPARRPRPVEMSITNSRPREKRYVQLPAR
jgi:hypothetical protein